jgi:hypothetical protein
MLNFNLSKNRIAKKRAIIKGLNGEYLISANGKIAFVIDSSLNVLYVIDEKNICTKYSKDQILEVSIEDESQKGYKRNLFTSIVWYQIGKMIDKEGGLQKVLSGLVTEKEIVTITKLWIRIVVKDFNNPYYALVLFDGQNASNKRESYKIATRWYSLINVLKHQ